VLDLSCLTLKWPETPTWVEGFCQHCFKKWLGARSAPIHFLKQCWFWIDYSLRNKLQSSTFQNSYIFLEKIRLENIHLLSIPKGHGHLRVNVKCFEFYPCYYNAWFLWHVNKEYEFMSFQSYPFLKKVFLQFAAADWWEFGASWSVVILYLQMFLCEFAARASAGTI